MPIFGPPLAGRCLGPYLNVGPVLAPTHVQKWRWPRGKDRPGLSPRHAQRHTYNGSIDPSGLGIIEETWPRPT